MQVHLGTFAFEKNVSSLHFPYIHGGGGSKSRQAYYGYFQEFWPILMCIQHRRETHVVEQILYKSHVIRMR